MTDLSLSATDVLAAPVVDDAEKARDLSYIVAFAAVGLFVSMMSLVVSSAEWLPEGAITVAFASAG